MEDYTFYEEGLSTNSILKYKIAMKGSYQLEFFSKPSKKRTSIYRMEHWNFRKEREGSGNEKTPTKLKIKWDSYCSNWQS